MALHKTNSLLKFVLLPVIVVAIIAAIFLHGGASSNKPNAPLAAAVSSRKINTNAVNDSAAESLDTLTAELAATKKNVREITQDNATLKTQNTQLIQKLQNKQATTTATLTSEMDQLKAEIQTPQSSTYTVHNGNAAAPIHQVPDMSIGTVKNGNWQQLIGQGAGSHNTTAQTPAPHTAKKPKPIPYYTIPANATAVRDRLMTALVGRIPVKGVVTDPYPFKIVFSDDTLAANGLRVPHLRQMVVSGYTEGDLNLLSVRGWVTSLTFVFDDGTISTTTSNDNNIGHFTKQNALGYLSDAHGNPFIRGKLITNAPTYLTGNVLLGAAQGAASAYAQSQTTNQTNIFGSSTSTVTGSPSKYVMGQAGVNAANEAQQWWHDREEQSFDAIYVPTVEPNGAPVEIAVNFSKQIDIDYNPIGRKLDYAHSVPTHVVRSLD